MAELDQRDVLGTWAFLPTAFGVGHLLAFMQLLKSDTLQAIRVEEQVFCSSCVDESETLVRQFLDAAFGHL